MKTLQRYIGRDVLFATMLIFCALLALFAFFDLIHELGDVGQCDLTTRHYAHENDVQNESILNE